MKNRRLSILALVCACAFSVTAPARADEADTLFAQGGAAFNAQKYDEALRAFQGAWKLRQSYDIAGALAQAELQLGKHRDAAEHLAFALRTFPATGDDGLRKTLESAFADARKQVAALRVRVSVDKADVTVNGKRAGVAPIAEELFADAGTVTVEATLDGYESAKQTLEAKKGEERDVTLTLAPKQTPQGRSIVPPAIAFGVGGAGLLVGAITGGVSIAQFGDLKKSCGGDTVCPENFRGDVDAGKALSHVSTASFVIAGVGAAVGTTLLFLPIGGAPARASAVVGPGFVGVKGSF